MKVSTRKFIITSISAWLIFIMVDFFFHASLFSFFWLGDQPALKSLTNLAVLIPAGYASFLLLTLLVGWLYCSIYPQFVGWSKAISFALVFAGLFALSNFLGLYSYINLDFVSLLMINLVYFIEIICVVLVFAYFQPEGKVSAKIWRMLVIFIVGIVISIVIQNLTNAYVVNG